MSDKSGNLVKMKIIAHSDAQFTNPGQYIEVQFNPATLKYTQEVLYSGGKNMGTSIAASTFNRMKTSTLSVDLVFDETGVVPLTDGKQQTDIPQLIDKLEKVAYRINNDIHRPNFLILSWGSFIYKGQLTLLTYDYTLFRPDGSPLRVKVNMTLNGYLDPLTEAKKVGRSSPDLSRRIRLTDGETLAMWCTKIYGDASYCADVARSNGLSGFRDIPGGTELVFPPLERD